MDVRKQDLRRDPGTWTAGNAVTATRTFSTSLRDK